MANNLIDLLKTGTLLLYPDSELRQAAAKTICIESSRGLRLGKAKQSDRVDPIISLAMSALACVQAGRPEPISWSSAKPHIPPGRFDERPVGDRLFARGEDVAAAEDRAAAQVGQQWSSRWKRSGY